MRPLSTSCHTSGQWWRREQSHDSCSVRTTIKGIDETLHENEKLWRNPPDLDGSHGQQQKHCGQPHDSSWRSPSPWKSTFERYQDRNTGISLIECTKYTSLESLELLTWVRNPSTRMQYRGSGDRRGRSRGGKDMRRGQGQPQTPLLLV